MNLDLIVTNFDGAELKRRRLAAGWGRMKFAKRLGTDHGQVWKWETGAVQPSKRYLSRIVDQLGCDPDDLYRVVD